MPSDVLITPASSKIDFTDGSNATKRLNISGTAFSFNSNLNVLSSTSLSSAFKAEGVNGTLFEVTDDLSNSLLSVNTIGGLPVFEVFANNSIIGGQYGANDFVISGNKIGLGLSNPVNKLSVSGAVSIGSSYNVAAPSNGLIVQGDVGIGVTSFAYSSANRANLEMYGSGESLLALRNSTGNSYIQKSGADFYINNTTNGFIAISNNGSERWRITNAGVLQSNAAQTIQTSTGNLTLATAAGDGHILLSPHNNGNVGIGTATPVSKFVVNGGTVNTSTYTVSEARIADGSLHLMKTVAGGIFESIRAMNADTTAGTTVRFLAASTSDPFNNANGGKVFIDAIRTSTNMDLAFSLNDVAGAAPVERVRFMGNGNVGVGTISPGTKLDVVGAVTMPVIRQSATLYAGTDITDDDSTRTVYFNIPLGGYSPPKYFKVARIKITGNYQNVSLNGYFTTTNSTGLHVGSERKVEFDFIAYAATNPGAPTVTYLKRGPDTTNVLVYAVPNGGGAGTTYYDVYIKSAWYNDTNGELAVRVGYSSAVTIWQTGLDSGTSAPVDTLVNPNSNYSFDTTGYVGIGTTNANRKLTVYGDGTLLSLQSPSANQYSEIEFTANGVGSAYIFKASAGYTTYGGVGAFNIYNAGSIAFHSSSNNNTVYIRADGNVGIGTNSPTQVLDVRGNIKLGADNSGSYIYYIKDNEGTIIRTARSDITQVGLFRSDGWGNFTVDKSIGIGYSLGTGFASSTIGNGNLYVANNVGIGTTIPSAKLQVIVGNAPGISLFTNNATQYAYLQIGRTSSELELGVVSGSNQFFTGTVTGDAVIKQNSTGKLHLGYGSAAPAISIDSSNNVGIGNTSPTSKLQVNGGIQFGYGSDSIFYTGTEFDSSKYLILQNNTDSYGRIGLVINAKTFNGANTPSVNDAWSIDSPRSGIRFRGWLTGDADYQTKFAIQHLLAGTSGYGDLGIFARLFSTTIPAIMLSAAGSLAVGTSNPANKVHIVQSIPTGNASAPANTTLRLDSSGNNYLSFVNTADNQTYAGLTFTDNNVGGYIVFRNYTGDVTNGSDSLIYGTYQDHIFQTGTTSGVNSRNEVMRIKNGGNVGIGSNAPNNKLHINGSTSIGSGYNTAAPTDGLIVQGNVGIGISSPLSKLHLVGSHVGGSGFIRLEASDYPIISLKAPGTGDGSAGYWGVRAQDTSNNDLMFYGYRYTSAFSGFWIDPDFGSVVTKGFFVKRSDGNVGIGINTPSARLHANSTTSGATLLRADGTNGTLFSVVDDLSDSLMSVNNSAGLPVLEVFADDRVVAGQYGANDFVLVNNKIGIGNANPLFKLDVTGSFGLNAGANDGNWPFLVVDTSSSGGPNRYALNKIGAMGFNNADNYAQLQLVGSSGAYIDFANAAVDDMDARLIYYSNSRLDLIYGTTMTINSSGIGIGTVNPGTSLEIYATPATSTTLRQMLIINTDFGSASGTGFGGSIVFRGKTAGNVLQDNAQISAYNEDAGDNGYALGFYTRPTVAGGLTQRMTIARGGNVGIGTVSPSQKLEVQGSVQIGNDSVNSASLKLTRLSSSIRTSEHIFHSTSNSPWYTFGQNLTWTGELAGTVESSHAYRPYFEGFAPVTGYKVFGFINITSGSFTSANIVNSLALDNTGKVGIGTTNPGALLQVGTLLPTTSINGIQFGDDTGTRLYRSASGIVTCSGTIAATFSGNLTGNVTGNVTGSSGSAGYLTGGDSAFYAILYNTTSADLNTFNTAGLHSAEYTGSTNNPTGSVANGHFIQISDAGGTDVKTQWYYNNAGSDIYMRLMWGNGTWRSWRKLLHDGNYNSYALPLAGGTTTGMVSAYTTFSSNDDWQNSPISIRERALVNNAQSANTYAPNLNFHWGGRVSKSLWLDANGILNFGEYDSSGNPAYDGYFRTDTIHAASKIGVGIASPTAKLNVLSSTSLSSVLKTEGVNGTLFEVTDDLSNSLMSVNTIGGLPVFEVFANNSIVAGQYGKNDFVISGNKIGIATASPTSQLEVGNVNTSGTGITVSARYDQSEAYIRFRTGHPNNSNVWETANISATDGGNYNGTLSFRTAVSSQSSPSTKMTILPTGNVGIGITSPSYKLHVNGTSGFEDTLNISVDQRIQTYPASTGGYGMGLTLWSANTSGASEAYGRPGFIGRNLSWNGSNFIAATTNSSNNWGVVAGAMFTNNDVRFLTRAASENGLNYSLGTNIDSITRMLINTSGNVGIGITSPAAKLDVAGVIRGDAGANYPHSFTNTDAGNTHWTDRGQRLLTSNGANWTADGRDPIIALVTSGNSNNLNIANSIGLALHNESQTNNTFSPAITFSNRSNSGSYNTAYAAIIGKKTGQGVDSNWSAGELHFYTMPVSAYVSNIPSLMIDSAGKVGIGTTTPATTLQINTGTPTAATGGIQFGDDTGTRIYRGGANYIQTSSGLQSGAWFYAATYLQTGGNLIYPSSYSATQRLEVGNVANNGWIDGLTIAPGGNVVVTGTLTESSSIRYKENIQTITAPILPKLEAIRPVTYNKKDNPNNTEYGIIAEELNELFPEFVNKNDNGEVESVNYSRLTVLLIKAVKELKEEVDRLKNK